TIDTFVALRRKEPGLRQGDLVSPATVNHDLRHIKAVLAVPVEWGYLDKLPKFRFEKEPKKPPRYVTRDRPDARGLPLRRGRLVAGAPSSATARRPVSRPKRSLPRAGSSSTSTSTASGGRTRRT